MTNLSNDWLLRDSVFTVSCCCNLEVFYYNVALTFMINNNNNKNSATTNNSEIPEKFKLRYANGRYHYKYFLWNVLSASWHSTQSLTCSYTYGFPITRENFNNLFIKGYTCTEQPQCYFYSWCEIWHHRCVPWSQFPITRENFGDLQTFKADIGLFMFAWIFRTSWLKRGFLRAK